MSRALAVPSPGRTVAIAISRSVRDDARRVLGARTRIEVVYNGIDTREWSSDGPTLDLDAAAGLGAPPAHTVRVGLVATMARWKGHEVFLRALALLPPSLRLRGYVIGGSIYETEASQHTIDDLRSLASALGLDDRVGFTGFIEDAAQAMRALDIVVHASVRPEPFGRVIIEGMATGTAVIARANGGAAELFVAGTEAMACSTDAPNELARVLERLSGDEALRRSLGEHGRARVRRDFSRERMTSAIVQIYDDVLSPRDSG
jgi:glycosyltransferase involved in cell wall biosynthesis